MGEIIDENSEGSNIEEGESSKEIPINKELTKKQPKRGIIYLATIPPYMNVTRIREVFEQYGKLGRVYMQLAEPVKKNGEAVKTKKKKPSKKFTEGWVEFERKSIAKKVASLLNNTQVSTRKNSKHYDTIWNIKYLPSFKWTHLHERLAYEKAARRNKIRAEIQLAKKQTNFFTTNIDRKKKKKEFVNKNLIEINKNKGEAKETREEETQPNAEERKEFLKTLFTS